MKRLFTTTMILSLFFGLGLLAQVPMGKAVEGGLLLKGGTVHLGNGSVIEAGAVAFKDGTITWIGPASEATSDFKVVDTTGQHIYPGLILADSDLGLVEVGSVRASDDTREVGRIRPNIRAITAYNTDSELIPVTRYAGVTHAQIRIGGGMISGMSSVVQLDAWNWEDAAVKTDEGLRLGWPSRTIRRWDWSSMSLVREKNKNYDEQLQELARTFAEAATYPAALKAGAPVNLKLAAIVPVFDGSRTVYVEADKARSIMEAVLKLKEWGVKRIVIVGAEEAYKITDFIKKHEIPLIIEKTHRLPSENTDDLNLPFKIPGMLADAGLTFTMSMGNRMNARNLPFAMGTAAAWGLDKERALQAITLDSAKILGIDDRCGSLEVGKQANLFVSKGDALDMRSNQLSHLFIEGREVPLEDGMQQRLNDRYRQKYGHP